jgi:hypothetical protein
VFASKARCGPIPLRLAYLWGAPRDQACARTLAGRLGESEAFGVPQRGTAYQPGVKPRGVAHNRSVLKERRIPQTVPRRGRDGTSVGGIGGALRGISPALAGNVGASGAFRLNARGGYRVWTFLCSLRTYPAAAG